MSPFRFSVLLALTALAATAPTTAQQIGAERDRTDRYVIPDTTHAGRYVRSRIGLLISPARRACTASLISENLILTAGHCLGNEKDQFAIGEYVFCLGFRENACDRVVDIGFVRFGSVSSDRGGGPIREANVDLDWAIMGLTEDLGSAVGSGCIDFRCSA